MAGRGLVDPGIACDCSAENKHSYFKYRPGMYNKYIKIEFNKVMQDK
jgi:hypothetical protein